MLPNNGTANDVPNPFGGFVDPKVETGVSATALVGADVAPKVNVEDGLASIC